jgi:MBG domain (YGX type)/Bacterial pre-peptidase C-terminal domain/PKD domain/RTX calcium-binding nonapeptide repeat (4 copies)
MRRTIRSIPLCICHSIPWPCPTRPQPESRRERSGKSAPPLQIDPSTGRTEDDFYAISGRKGDVLTFETDSVEVSRLQGVDTVLSLYDASGNLIAINDDQFEGTDSLLLDVTLPADGMYYIKVSSFSRSPDDPIFDARNPLSPINPANLDSVLNPLNPNFDAKLLAQFLGTQSGTNVGQYDLIVYRFNAATPIAGAAGADVIDGRAGDDVIKAYSGFDTLIGGPGLDVIDNGSGGPGYAVTVTPSNPSPSLSSTASLQDSVSFADPSGSGSWIVTIDYGDQIVETTNLEANVAIPLSHRYATSGDYTVNITITNDDGQSGSAVISVHPGSNQPAQPVIKIRASDSTYNGLSYAGATATVSDSDGNAISDAPVTLTYYAGTSVSSLALTAPPIAAGTYTVMASFPGNAAYLPASDTAVFVIERALVTVNVNDALRSYGDPNPAFSGTVSGVADGDMLTATYSTNAGPSSSIGTYGIIASLSGPDNTRSNYIVTVFPGTLTVTPALLTVTASSTSKIYGQANPTLAVTYGGFKNSDDTSMLSGAPLMTTVATQASHAGSYAVNVSQGTLVSQNYTFTFFPGTLTVTPAVLTVTASSASKDYGQPNPALTATYSGFKNGDGNSVLSGMPGLTTAATQSSHVGSYPVNVSQETLASQDYTFTFVAGTLMVTPALLTVTASSASKAYGQAIPALTATYSGLKNGDTAASLSTPPKISTTATSASPVGQYPIVASGAVAADYTFAYIAGVLTATPAALTITAANATIVYGQPIPDFSATYSGFVNGDGPSSLHPGVTFTTTASGPTPAAGSYAIKPVGAANSNYTISYSNGTLTVATTALEADPSHPGKNMLLVGGTTSDDLINVIQVPSTGIVYALVNLRVVATTPASTLSRVMVFGGAGSDLITVDSSVASAAYLYGGAGDDILYAGSTGAVLVGGDGNDVAFGGGSRQILIGGAGQDALYGGSGDDILIGGTTDFDAPTAANFAALDSVLAEWNSSRSYAVRVANLSGTGTGTRLNGTAFLNATTVHNDNATDQLLGGSGLDWFLADLNAAHPKRDKVQSSNGETVTQIG